MNASKNEAMKIIDQMQSVSAEDLDAVEIELGLKLPRDLRSHFLLHNGGRPVPNLFPRQNEFFEIHGFLPVRHGVPGSRFEDAYVDLVKGNPAFPRSLIPIATDPGGDYFCYDTRPGRFGAIVCYQSEYFDDPSRAIVVVAPNLESFLNGMTSQ